MSGQAKNLLEYIQSKYAAVRWATGNAGARFIGVVATLWDGMAQGAVQTLSNRLPHYSDCAPDAEDQIGFDRELFRFSEETQDHWGNRVQKAWDQYEQAGTPQAVLADVVAWGESAYPGIWVVGPVPVPTIQETGWARFTLTLPYGSVPWGPPVAYDSGVHYDDGTLYDVSNADPVTIDHLRRLVRKWKPARSRGFIQVVLSLGVDFYDGGHHYDDGSIYAGPTDLLVLGV